MVILVGAPGSGKSTFCEDVMKISKHLWFRVCQVGFHFATTCLINVSLNFTLVSCAQTHFVMYTRMCFVWNCCMWRCKK